MNAAADAVSNAERGVAEIAAALAKWYADHAPIRRLWALEGSSGLEVLVALEPTSDGDDTLPIWFSNRRHWTNDLRQLLQRDVQLRMVVLDDFGEFDVDPDAVMITQLSWRVSWSLDDPFHN
jgi:hypothetical protein